MCFAVQHCIKAKYITRVHAAKEAIWLRQLLSKLGQGTLYLTPLLIDNQSAIMIAKNPEFHNCTKYIDIYYHFLWQVVNDNVVKLEYVSTRK